MRSGVVNRHCNCNVDFGQCVYQFGAGRGVFHVDGCRIVVLLTYLEAERLVRPVAASAWRVDLRIHAGTTCEPALAYDVVADVGHSSDGNSAAYLGLLAGHFRL